MPSDDIAISVRNLTKTYRLFGHPGDRIKQFLSCGMKRYHREFTALNDVSFDIKKGETIGIIGRNGSGKSTLLQLICGILKPTSGRAQANGRISALLELGAGFNPEFTGRENIYFQGALMGLTKAQIEERFDSIADFADIGDFMDQQVRIYSSGMFVRLAFAIMAHIDADVLVIDEALSVGDAQFNRKCMQYLQRFRRDGSLIVVSHDISMIRALSDRAIWLENGKTRLDGSVKQVCDAYQASTILNSAPSATKKVGAPSKPTSPACIIDVQLVDTSGASFSSATQGEVVTVIIKAKTSAPIEKPIVGFTLHNSLGRSIFGENTYLTFADRPFPLVAGEELEARFTFVMPRLVPGDYSICAAIVDGTQATHVMHDWFPDSLLIRVETGSTTGDLGIPMISIALEKLFSTTGKQKEKK